MGSAVGHTLLVAGLIGCVSLLYATAGQAGGTAFLAVMAFAAFPATEMRATALLLNIVAAGYATWRLHRRGVIDRRDAVAVDGSVAPDGISRWDACARRTGIFHPDRPVAGRRRWADGVQAHGRYGRSSPGSAFSGRRRGGRSRIHLGTHWVGGGVFLTPLLIAFGWASPKRAAALSPPFILCNSVVGLGGVLLAGQTLAPGTLLYSVGALAGAVIGTALGLRWMSERATRYALAVILLFAGLRLLFR